MNDSSIIILQPVLPATQLVLLMHGVGSDPRSMTGLASWFAAHNPEAFVVSVASPDPSDISAGQQWFSVRGITEENRQARVDAAMPGFVAAVCHWQQAAGVDAARTLIVGFSQGAIMALESTKLDDPPAGEIVAFAGRYATLPSRRPAAAIHLLHGEDDPIMPVSLAYATAARLTELGASPTLDVAPGVGHEPHPALLVPLAARLRAVPPMRH